MHDTKCMAALLIHPCKVAQFSFQTQLEHRLHHNTEEVGRMQAKHRTEISQKEQVCIVRHMYVHRLNTMCVLLWTEESALNENWIAISKHLVVYYKFVLKLL